MSENCICEVLAASGLNTSTLFPSECTRSCSCLDTRYHAPDCILMESEYIYRADVIMYSVFLVLNFVLLFAIVAEFVLISYNRYKKRKENKHHKSSASTYFASIATFLMALTEIFMLSYYTFRIHDSYVIEEQIGIIGRLSMAGLFGVGLAITLSFVCITWLEIMLTAKALEQKTLRIAKIIIFTLIGVFGPIAIVTSIVTPIMNSQGKLSIGRIVSVLNGIANMIILLGLLITMAPRAIRIWSWLSKQKADLHSIIGIALTKTRYVLGVMGVVVSVMILVILRVVVSVITNDDPRYRVVLEGLSLVTQFSTILLSLCIVSRYTMGIRIGVCPLHIHFVSTYDTPSVRKTTNSSSNKIDIVDNTSKTISVTHTPITISSRTSDDDYNDSDSTVTELHGVTDSQPTHSHSLSET